MAEQATTRPAHVFWSAEDEGFIAVSPHLPGCSAYGSTAREALDNLQIAIAAWYEAMAAACNPVPEQILVANGSNEPQGGA